MRYLVIIAIVFSCSVWLATAADPAQFKITAEQTTKIEQSLNNFEKGKVDVKTLNEDGGLEGNRLLVAYYLANSNAVTTKAKLPIGRAHASFQMFSEARALADDYVLEYPKDFHGWRLLGYACLSLQATNEALIAYEKGAKLGDRNSLGGFGLLSLAVGHFQKFKEEVLPRYLVLKDSKTVDEDEKLDIVSQIVAYAISQNDENLFVKAFDHISIEQAVKVDEIKDDISIARKTFKGKAAQKICKDFEAATKNATTNSSH